METTTTIRIGRKLHRTLLREKIRQRAHTMDEVIAHLYSETQAVRRLRKSYLSPITAENGREAQEQR